MLFVCWDLHRFIWVTGRRYKIEVIVMGLKLCYSNHRQIQFPINFDLGVSFRLFGIVERITEHLLRPDCERIFSCLNLLVGEPGRWLR